MQALFHASSAATISTFKVVGRPWMSSVQSSHEPPQDVVWNIPGCVETGREVRCIRSICSSCSILACKRMFQHCQRYCNLLSSLMFNPWLD